MTNKERLELNNAKIDEITKALEKKQVSPTDMLQARVDATNSCSYLFYYYSGTNLDFAKNLNTSNVTNMRNMFNYCSELTTIPQLDTSNVANMYHMFDRCTKLTEIPQLNTGNVTDMSSMFDHCSKLTTIPQLDTSKVTNMSYMFDYCSELPTIPQLETSKVTNIAYMFDYCSKLTTIPHLDTSKVTSMNSMFTSCSELTTIPQLDTSKASTMSYMFRYCSKLTTIHGLNLISNRSTVMFDGCKNLTNLTLKNINYSLRIGYGTSYGTLLTNESLINTFKELWDLTGSTSQTLTLSTTSKENIANIYVKLIEVTDEMRAEDEYIDNKKPCVVCESTDEGAMTLTEYATSKNWAIA